MKNEVAYEAPCCWIVQLQTGRILEGSQTPGTIKEIYYEDL